MMVVHKDDLSQLATEISQLKVNLPKVLNNTLAAARLERLEDGNTLNDFLIFFILVDNTQLLSLIKTLKGVDVENKMESIFVLSSVEKRKNEHIGTRIKTYWIAIIKVCLT